MTLIRKPLAWIPIVLPVGILGMLGYFLMRSRGTVVQSGDEGLAAHLFQLWIPLQAVLVLLFAVVWGRGQWRATVPILFLQVLLSLIPIGIVFYYQL